MHGSGCLLSMANVSYYHTKLRGMSLGIHGNSCMLRMHEHNNNNT